MKRILSAAVVLGLLFAAATASAQYRGGSVLLTLGAGSSFTKLKDSDDQISGTAAGMTLEKVLAGGKATMGFTLYWLSAGDDVTLEGDTTTSPVSYSSTPFAITGRWNFLNSRFAANIGLGLGFYTSKLFLYEGTTEQRQISESGMSISVPIGVAYFLDPDMYLQVSYVPAVMTATTVSEDLAHTVVLVAGFQWGGNKD